MKLELIHKKCARMPSGVVEDLGARSRLGS